MYTFSKKSALFMTGLFLLLCASCFDSNEGDFEKQLETDLALIDQYLADNGIVALKDSTKQIRFVIHEHGNGDIPTLDSCIRTTYEGKLLDTDEKFTEGLAQAFPLAGNLIQGWKLGIPLLKEGDLATFYIPSGLAYGTTGVPLDSIPPNANVLFHFKLLTVGTSYTSSPSPVGSCN